ncbi:MAG: hypothetical protein JEY99_07470 [Spirochaetales bacterium]|nr:hypothetical protein [Spirochaetales bacterium]
MPSLKLLFFFTLILQFSCSTLDPMLIEAPASDGVDSSVSEDSIDEFLSILEVPEGIEVFNEYYEVDNTPVSPEMMEPGIVDVAEPEHSDSPPPDKNSFENAAEDKFIENYSFYSDEVSSPEYPEIEEPSIDLTKTEDINEGQKYPSVDDLPQGSPWDPLVERDEKTTVIAVETAEHIEVYLGNDDASKEEVSIDINSSAGPISSDVSNIQDVPSQSVNQLAGLETGDYQVEQLNMVLSAAAGLNAPSGFTLDGSGWIYLGGSSNGSGSLEAELKGRTLKSSETAFTFVYPEPGVYTLMFMKQDLGDGGFRQMEITVDALPPEDYSELALRMGEDAIGSTGLGSSNAGEFEEVVTSVTEKSHSTLDDFMKGVEDDDIELFKEYWLEFLENGSISGRDSSLFSSLLNISDFLSKKNQDSLLFDTLSYLLDGNSPIHKMDSVYIRLGRVLEKEGPLKDLREALVFYGRLTGGFPASIYWDEADRRIKYLNRHYFQIR